ncbi:MAG: hypothetical protein KAR20_27045 [Candidatus Heimdallarchaeota archaeon]|nr:hypothetical protein [Candidatus Heimdallarchaeota archaeon]
MENRDWVLKVTEDIATIRADVTFIKQTMKPCNPEEIDSKIKTLKWLVGLLFTLTIGIITTLLSKVKTGI